MTTTSYAARRGQLLDYFDRTAVDAWIRLTSDAPVNSIRATVRAGRATMRQTLLDMLPTDLTGRRLLDAGCGTGALAIEAARRGADVLAIDLSPRLVALAQDRTPLGLGGGSIEFRVGDMLSPITERFDHIVAMDSLIHYKADDVLRVLGCLAAAADHSVVFTFAPRTPALAAMHLFGRLFPRGNRAPAIEPIAPAALRQKLTQSPSLAGWEIGRSARIATGFYISQALELRRT